MYTCMQDILAVGYGAFNTEEQIGIICCWSLKNPEVCKLVWCQVWKPSTSLACVSVALYPKSDLRDYKRLLEITRDYRGLLELLEIIRNWGRVGQAQRASGKINIP